MSQSIKLNDDNYVDTTGIYDSTIGKTQRSINDFLTQLPYIQWTELPSHSSDTETYFQEWLSYMISNGFLRESHVCIAPVNPNAQGWCIGYGLADGSHCGFMAQIYGLSSLFLFGKNTGTWFYTIK